MEHKLLGRMPTTWHTYIRTSMLALMLLTMLIHQSAVVRAAGDGPIIHWNSNMIYTGQNNGYPWGPVGENASVSGENFPPNLQVHLILAQGDSNNNPAICKTAAATVNAATTDSSGNFSQNFSWPVAAGQVNKEYSICAVRATDGSVVSHRDDGPFTVLASSPPVIDISSATVTAGGTVTVIGHNWVPPQQVNINIAGCADCEPGNTEVTTGAVNSTGLNDGSFSVTVTIPTSTKSGSYVVNAFTQSGMDANHITGVKHLTIQGLTPTPTPTATATSTPTATPTATATAGATATDVPTATATTDSGNTDANSSNTTSGNSGSGGTGWILGLLIAVAIVLLVIAGVIIFIVRQRSLTDPLSAPGGPQYGWSMQQNGPLVGSDQATQHIGSPSNYTYEQPNGFGPMVHACMNCGRPLAPNDMRCNGCGMPVGAGTGTQNPNVPQWGR